MLHLLQQFPHPLRFLVVMACLAAYVAAMSGLLCLAADKGKGGEDV